jgi:hypothetical protein
MHAVSIELSGLDPGNVAMPDKGSLLVQLNAFRLPSTASVIKAKLNFGCIFGIERKIDARAVPRGAKRKGFSR